VVDPVVAPLRLREEALHDLGSRTFDGKHPDIRQCFEDPLNVGKPSRGDVSHDRTWISCEVRGGAGDVLA